MNRQTLNIHDAVSQGETIIIAKAGKPVAELIAISRTPARKSGALKGKINIADDFDAPLADEVLDSFEGN